MAANRIREREYWAMDHVRASIALNRLFSRSSSYASYNRQKEEEAQMPDRILFVDDEARILDALREFFIDSGYEVDCALSPDLAKMLLSGQRYLAVISDISFSGLNGREGLDLIDHVQLHFTATPVIVLTAHFSPELEREALSRGACAFLTKPTSLLVMETLVRGLKTQPGLV